MFDVANTYVCMLIYKHTHTHTHIQALIQQRWEGAKRHVLLWMYAFERYHKYEKNDENNQQCRARGIPPTIVIRRVANFRKKVLALPVYMRIRIECGGAVEYLCWEMTIVFPRSFKIRKTNDFDVEVNCARSGENLSGIHVRLLNFNSKTVHAPVAYNIRS